MFAFTIKDLETGNNVDLIGNGRSDGLHVPAYICEAIEAHFKLEQNTLEWWYSMDDGGSVVFTCDEEPRFTGNLVLADLMAASQEAWAAKPAGPEMVSYESAEVVA